MRSRMASKGVDPRKLGRWTWVQIEGKAGEATMFVSAYYHFKNKKRMSTVWNQQVSTFEDIYMY